MIKEMINDGSRIDANGKLDGCVVYEFQSPTHWSSPCLVKVFYSSYKETEITLDYGCGGVNKGFTSVEIAEAMSEVFSRAADRMKKLQSQMIDGSLFKQGDSK